jgi:DNA-directed RNA polymerase subunit beta'
VDVAQDVIIREIDCGTEAASTSRRSTEGGDFSRGPGRAGSRAARLSEDIVHPETGEVLVEKGKMIADDVAKNIEAAASSGSGCARFAVRVAAGCLRDLLRP